jgi:hypothetical protein
VVGEGELDGLLYARLGVTTGGIRRATAPRSARVRPALRTDRRYPARTARVRKRGGAVRGASGEGEHREVWGLGRCTTSDRGALGRREGHGRRGSAGDARRTGA